MTEKQLAKAVGDNVRAAREKQGKTQAQLSEILEMAVPHISRLEVGAHLPSLKTLLRVANALEVSICSLVEEKTAKPGRSKKRRPDA